MTARRRSKRATVEDLYKSCKQGGDCPPDVVNKVERNTLADKILKWASGVIYLGGLGIGTGSGRGTGGVSVGRGAGSFRPSVPIDTIGPLETPLGPVDSTPILEDPGLVLPTDPSLIELERFPVATEDEGPLLPPPPSVVDEDVYLPPRIPEVDVGGESTPAILEVSPQIPEPNVISRTQYSNPAFEVSLTGTNTAGELSAGDHVFVDSGGGEVIGQRIPLVELTPREDFDVSIQEETSFMTSTPRTRPVRPITYRPRVPPPMSRMQQVEVDNSTFLRSPGRLVAFDFINPAYEDEVSLIFQQELDDLARAAPDPDFQDVVRLGRPRYERGPSGAVRVSRIGQRGTIRTRSGVQIGSHVHYYHELSEIAPNNPLDLPPPGEQSMETSFVQPFSEEGFEIVNLNEVDEIVADEDLVDSFSDVQDVALNLQLSFDLGNFQPQSATVPLPEVRKPAGIYVDIPFPGYVVDADRSHTGDSGGIIPNVVPDVIFDPYSQDFYLHPSLLRRKRRRRQYVVIY